MREGTLAVFTQNLAISGANQVLLNVLKVCCDHAQEGNEAEGGIEREQGASKTSAGRDTRAVPTTAAPTAAPAAPTTAAPSAPSNEAGGWRSKKRDLPFPTELPSQATKRGAGNQSKRRVLPSWKR